MNLSGDSTWTKENWSSLPLALSSEMMAGGKKQYYLDLETGLYLLGTGTNGRYYDPATARFMSEDPIRHASGDPNLFTYVQNDPIDKLDPSGHEDEKDNVAKLQQIKHLTNPSDQKPSSPAGASKPSDGTRNLSGVQYVDARREASTGQGICHCEEAHRRSGRQ